MKIRSVLIVLCLLVSSCTVKPKPVPIQDFSRVLVSSTQTPCVDTLALPKYPDSVKAVPLHFGIGTFAKTFGDAFPFVKKELERGRKYIRVNLLWSDSHSYGDKDIKAITAESKRYQILCANFPDRKIELAPFTEHNIKNADKYLNIVQANAPNCGVVNSVWQGGFTKNPKYKNEVHGTHAKPNVPGVKYNYSYDGTNSVDSDVVAMLEKHKGAELFCMWHPRNNGKWNMKDATPRPERKAWPNRDMLESQVYLFTNKGKTNVPKNWLVKSHAEKHNATDTKGDKLLIISPVKSNAIVLKRDNQKIATLTFYGSYEGGGWRYYAQQMGYKFGAALDMFIGSKKYGVINGGFRDGTYR